jgi:hypothetical protein
MPPSALLRELSAAGLTLTPEPRARLRFTLLGRTLTFTASPWSVRLGRANTPTITASEPAPPDPVEPCDLIAEIAALAKNAEQTPVPLVADGPCLNATVSSVGGPDASAWRLPCPNFARQRAQHAWENGYADALHFLAEDVATFAAAIVAHHLSPDAKTAREVRLCGIRAAGQIVAMVKRVSP